MNLQIVHKGGPCAHASHSYEATCDYPASCDGGLSHADDAHHPVALAVVTVGDLETRRAIAVLVEDNVSLVEVLVAERLRTLPHHINRDDLVSAGMLALVTSASAYQPDRGASFRSFAALRIRGALLDELRGMDWASRSVRSRARELESVARQLTNILERVPSAAEVAAKMGISARALDAIQADLVRSTVISLQGFSPETMPDVLADHTPGPESLLLHREQLGYLHDAIDALPERLRTVVEAYFFQNRQMGEIAAALSVTQSRVSQMCAEAVALLRDGMNSQLDPEALAPLARTGRAAAARSAYYEALACRNTVAGRLAMSNTHGEMHRRTHVEAPERASRIA